MHSCALAVCWRSHAVGSWWLCSHTVVLARDNIQGHLVLRLIDDHDPKAVRNRAVHDEAEHDEAAAAYTEINRGEGDGGS